MRRLNEPRLDAGSFRDPSGCVFFSEDRVFRIVTSAAAADYESARTCGLIARLEESGRLIASIERDAGSVSLPSGLKGQVRHVVEHPRIPFISYPYEWPFDALQSAALLHLDVQLEALEADHCLSDATAYNVQFIGAKPIFIDVLSIRRYVNGEFWLGHRQFCEQFLNPLLLQAYVGTGYNEWYRGRLAGIAATDLATLLPAWRFLGIKTLMHVGVQAHAQRMARRQTFATRGRQLPKVALRGMLHGLRSWISGLTPRNLGKTVWSDYPEQCSYDAAQESFKQGVVKKFVAVRPPALMYDIGCNAGAFSLTAVRAGARYVVGMDSDHGVLRRAFRTAQEQELPFLPLCMDLTNPSPDQGWNQCERRGLRTRGPADAVLALAVVHHLAIGSNIPLDLVASWLASLAPRALIEFVPKTDPMVRLMLANRPDIFPDYQAESFRATLARLGRIEAEVQVPGSGRLLFEVTFEDRGSSHCSG